MHVSLAPTPPAQKPNLLLRPSRVRRRENAPGLSVAATNRSALVIAAAIGVAVVAWAAAMLIYPPLRLVALAPRPQVAVEATSSLCRLFAALVLYFFSQGEARLRLRWVTVGLLIMGIGGLGFGNLWPMQAQAININGPIYASRLVWGTAGLLFAVGLLWPRPLSLTPRIAIIVGLTFGGLSWVILAAHERLRPLATVTDINLKQATASMPMPGLTAWHWGLSSALVVVTVGAAVGVLVHGRGEPWQAWLAPAFVVLAGAQLHDALWPSAYSSVLTSAGILRLTFGLVVAIGGVLELRRLANERANLLAASEAHSASLTQLATMKADFTGMVAHELGSPIAAIDAWVEVLAQKALKPAEESHAFASIRAEIERLNGLAADTRAIATIEHDEFVIRPRRVHITTIITTGAHLNRSLPGQHPLLTTVNAYDDVWADAERIGQVLRNLLGNAAKYSPTGSPIELRTARQGDRIRIQVIDRGPGIAPGDEERIFEKYERGRVNDALQRHTAGVGLGLYLSRRIVQAHGGDISVTATPGGGATFAFDLKVAE